MPRINSFALSVFLTACTVPASKPWEMNSYYAETAPPIHHTTVLPAPADRHDVGKPEIDVVSIQKKLEHAEGEAKSLRETLPNKPTQ